MTEHTPVLLEEAVLKLDARPGRTYVDSTVGTGGHARRILEMSSPDGVLVAIDRDDEALRIAREALSGFGDRVLFFNKRFSLLNEILDQAGVAQADGFLFDLGVSAIQVDSPERGFSYRMNGPLDMRMDQKEALTAADLLDELNVVELEQMIRAYGEERWSRRVARSIVRERMKGRVESTAELASLVRRSVGGQYAHKSVARVFQALRIRVNEELQELEAGLDDRFLQEGLHALVAKGPPRADVAGLHEGARRVRLRVGPLAQAVQVGREVERCRGKGPRREFDDVGDLLQRRLRRWERHEPGEGTTGQGNHAIQ